MNPFRNLHRLEFVVTYRCNAHCKHCQVGPEQRASLPRAIDAELAVQIVRRVAGAYALRSLMTFGGEPLLFPGTVCAIHQAAAEAGIAHRSIITNAGTPRPAAAFHELARRLAESGVNDVLISVDAFHQEHIPLEVVERNARALLDAGIGDLAWNPCWVVSREHDNPWNQRTREILSVLAHLPVREDEGNVVQPMGYACEWLGAFLPPRVPMPSGTCGDVPYTGPLDEVDSIGVDPDGSIGVCWDLNIGSAACEDVLQILRGYDPRRMPETRAILQGGMAGLLELARARGIEPDAEGYYSVCDACRSLRRRMQDYRG